VPIQSSFAPHQGLRHISVLKILLCTYARKVEAGCVDVRHSVADVSVTASISIGKRVTEPVSCRVGRPWIIVSRRDIAEGSYPPL
jgi:hypothetical protein